MAVVVYPLDAVADAPSYTGRMLRETVAVLLGAATAARPLGILSGVRPGTPSSTISISGTTVTIAEHAGAIDAEAAAEAGPYLYALNTSFTQVLDAADASNPRTDAFVLQISDPAESDGTSTPGGAIVYVPGTAGSGAPMPTLPARSLLLGSASVPKSGGGSPTVSWLAPVLVAAGGILPVPSATYPSSPYVGQYVDDATLGLLRWDGSLWVPVMKFNTQLDTSNTTGVALLVQTGIAKVTGGNAASVTKAVTFPAAFKSGTIPAVSLSYMGARATGTFNPASLPGVGTAVPATAASISETGFTAALTLLSGNFGSTFDYYFCWTAIGQSA